MHQNQKVRQFKQTETGQAMVEFALAIPLVLVLICSILEFGWMCSNQLEVSNICREATRYGITYSADAANTSMVKTRAQQLATGKMQGKLDVTVNYSRPTDIRTGDITVTVQYKAPVLTPLAGFVMGDTHQITSQCTMKMS